MTGELGLVDVVRRRNGGLADTVGVDLVPLEA
jgi:hypothetical protein